MHAFHSFFRSAVSIHGCFPIYNASLVPLQQHVSSKFDDVVGGEHQINLAAKMLEMGKTRLFFFVGSLLAAAVLGCRCPPLELGNYYDLASTVVEVSVLDVGPAPCPDTGCVPGLESITYTLAVTSLFKGCAPLSLLFFAQTSTSSSECGIKLELGETWLLFLPEPTSFPLSSGPGDLFFINTCQGNRLGTSISDVERSWLEDVATLPENQCPSDASSEAATVATPAP